MKDAAGDGVTTTPPAPRGPVGGRLFRKYVALVTSVVCLALLAHGLFGIWSSYQDHRTSLIRIQREQATLAATKIGQFIKEIENQLGWVTQFPLTAVTAEEQRFDALRLLRQAPAITEFARLDHAGREQLRVSRVAMDVVGSQRDLSREPAFVEAMAHKVYYGPVYLRRGSEPYLTLAVAGPRRDAGVGVAEVNLIHVWDVVSQIKVGRKGNAYVVDATGRLIAHPDLSLVLRNTDLSHLAQAELARAGGGGASSEQAQVTQDLQGRRVLAAHAAITPLGWLVFVELPLDEAYAPVYASILVTGLVLLAALVLAAVASLVLARKMVRPIRALQSGAARIGSGALDQRIEVATGDELEALGDQFNSMAAQLRESYASLERKVQERTQQLEVANRAKARFLAAASHDLRQPLHALNLFVAQLRDERDQAERARLVARIDAAVGAMNELFDALLDISKLDAGVLTPRISEFPIARVLARIETTFTAAAREKGLRLRVVPSSVWVRSDFILLERILLNLAANAVRYTERGGIVVGCRRRAGRVRVDVCDSGIGVPEDQRRDIFGEFYQVAGPGQDRRAGLGLGLAIVNRLCALLDHPIELISTVGRGSRFSVSVPSVPAREQGALATDLPQLADDAIRDSLVFVVDDDNLVREGMRGLLQSWGCRVITAGSEDAALVALAKQDRPPDVIVCDYRLAHGKTGFELIERLEHACGGPIPAFLISGDTAPERLREARASGYPLLHKPVTPMALRAVITAFLKDRDAGRLRFTRTASAGSRIHEPEAAPRRAPPLR